MSQEQQSVEAIKDQLQRVGNKGFVPTLRDILDELELLSSLASAGIDAAAAELGDGLIDPESMRRKGALGHLAEQLSSIHSTLAVAICALAAVRNNAISCANGFASCEDISIERALAELLRLHPNLLGDEAAELAMRMGDDSPMAEIRHQLNSLLRQQGEA